LYFMSHYQFPLSKLLHISTAGHKNDIVMKSSQLTVTKYYVFDCLCQIAHS